MRFEFWKDEENHLWIAQSSKMVKSHQNCFLSSITSGPITWGQAVTYLFSLHEKIDSSKYEIR